MPDKNKESHVYHHTSETSPAPGVTKGAKTSPSGIMHEIPVWAWWAIAFATIIIVFWRLHSSSKNAANPTTIAPVDPNTGTVANQTSTGNLQASGQAPIIINASIQEDPAELAAMQQENDLLQRLLQQYQGWHVNPPHPIKAPPPPVVTDTNSPGAISTGEGQFVETWLAIRNGIEHTQLIPSDIPGWSIWYPNGTPPNPLSQENLLDSVQPHTPAVEPPTPTTPFVNHSKSNYPIFGSPYHPNPMPKPGGPFGPNPIPVIHGGPGKEEEIMPLIRERRYVA